LTAAIRAEQVAPAVGLQSGDGVGRHEIDQVHVAAEQGRHAGGTVADLANRHMVPIRPPAPVTVVAGQQQPAAPIPAEVAVGAPVPIAAVVPSKSAVVLPEAACWETMDSALRSLGNSGAGPLVSIRTVSGSIPSDRPIDFASIAKEEGLFGTFDARSSENTTSSAVKDVPSLNSTPGRSLISHWVDAIGVQDSASAGCSRCRSSWAISVSKTLCEVALLGPRLWNYGSSEVVSVATAMRASAAQARSGSSSGSTQARLTAKVLWILDAMISSAARCLAH